MQDIDVEAGQRLRNSGDQGLGTPRRLRHGAGVPRRQCAEQDHAGTRGRRGACADGPACAPRRDRAGGAETDASGTGDAGDGQRAATGRQGSLRHHLRGRCRHPQHHALPGAGRQQAFLRAAAPRRRCLRSVRARHRELRGRYREDPLRRRHAAGRAAAGAAADFARADGRPVRRRGEARCQGHRAHQPAGAGLQRHAARVGAGVLRRPVRQSRHRKRDPRADRGRGQPAAHPRAGRSQHGDARPDKLHRQAGRFQGARGRHRAGLDRRRRTRGEDRERRQVDAELPADGKRGLLDRARTRARGRQWLQGRSQLRHAGATGMAVGVARAVPRCWIRLRR